MKPANWTDRFRYAFDNTLARGPLALVGWLALLSAAFVLVLAAIAMQLNANPDFGFGETLWTMVLQALAPNPIDVNSAPPLFLGLMFVITLGGIFIVSLFIGVLTSDLDRRVGELRKGRSRVIERDHTVILGWSQQIFSVIAQLAVARAEAGTKGCVVVLADRDKVAMEDELQTRVQHLGRMRIVCRSGDPIAMESLAVASVDTARAIIVLGPDSEDPDASVIKTVLAITNRPDRRPEPYHIVAEIRNPNNMAVARMVGRDETEYVLIGDVIARIVAQTCRQSGLSIIYTELLNFEGDEIYFKAEPALVGSTFADALLAYEDCAVIGLWSPGHPPELNPPGDTRIRDGDQIVAIARDATAIRLSDRQQATCGAPSSANSAPGQSSPERTLILGWNWRCPVIAAQLDEYVSAGSQLTVVARNVDPSEAARNLGSRLRNQKVQFVQGDTTDRAVLDGLDIPSFNHVIVLSYSDTLDREEADAHTLMTLLHLRDIADRYGHPFSIVSEMLEIRNRVLAEVTRADDFVVSDNVISLMIAQISENRQLSPLFNELFDHEGSEVYLRPAADYLVVGTPVYFYAVVEAARARGEVAIGYRLVRTGGTASREHGIVINPRKSAIVTFGAGDKIIVLAEK